MQAILTLLCFTCKSDTLLTLLSIKPVNEFKIAMNLLIVWVIIINLADIKNSV